MTAPRVADRVHYVSHGSPVLPDGSQRFKSECRAAIVTGLCDKLEFQAEHECDNPCGSGCVSLAVLNPTGMFFDLHVAQSEEREFHGGTWHWPEQG